MNALKWLGRPRRISYEIEYLEREYNALLGRMENVTQNYSGDTGTGTKDPHKMDAIAIVAADLEAKRDELEAAKLEIRAAINRMPSARERLALRLYFLRGMSWPQVAGSLGVTVRRVLDIRKAAIEHVTPFIEEG